MKRKKKLFLILVMFLLITSSVKIVESKNGNVMVTAFAASASVSSPETKAQLQEITSVADADTLKNYFENKNHSEFLPVALAIKKACRCYDLPFETVLAISILESGYGESEVARKKRNFFGIGAVDEMPFESASDFSEVLLEEAINEQIRILERDYFSKYKDLDEISKVYCSNSEFWLQEIQYIQNEIKNNTHKKEGVLK